MATGLQASANVNSIDSWQLVAILPNTTISYNVHICNRASTPVVISVAPMSTQATVGPTVSEEFESGLQIPPNSSFPITSLVTGVTSYVWIKASQLSVSVNVYGIEG